jgi:uncharacterized OB-fold protein
LSNGVVYTETIVFSPPAQYAEDAPYQLAIIDLESGKRLTVRVLGERVRIGDQVAFVESKGGVAYYQKA